MANPLEFSSDLSVGIAAIQAAALGSGATTAPLHIYVPAGDYFLTDPITITRHKVTLEIDGGATIHVASGKQGLVLDGASNADGYLMHLVIRSYGVIQGTDFTTELDAVYLNSVIHSDFFFNEIKWVGRDGIRMSGSCFSNKVMWNRIHGTTGWNVNFGGAGTINSSLFDGECQSGGLGGINAVKAMYCRFRGIIENQSVDGVPGLLLDSARGNSIGIWFETNAGDDIKTAATYWSCYDNVVDAPTVFNDQKSSPDYNINIVAGTSESFYLRHCTANFQTGRFLNIGGSGNANAVIGEEANIIDAAVTDATSTTRWLKPLSATFTWDPGNLADGAGETSVGVTVTGAALAVGHRVEVSAPYDLQGIICVGYVSAANTVRVRLQNETGGAINLTSGTWRVVVRRD